MAQTQAKTVEGTAPHGTGASESGNGRILEVQNPATGQTIARVPAIGTDDVAELAARARAAQPGWEALGFEGRAKVLKRAQRWTTDNADRIARTIISETGKTYEDAQLAEISYAAQSFGFWAKNAEDYLSDEKIRCPHPCWPAVSSSCATGRWAWWA